MPMVSEGDLAAARRLARRNLRILSEAVRQGYRIIATEPSAVTCLTHDYPLLVDDEEAQRVAMATGDATAFLLEMHREGRLRLDFKPLATRLLYHTPCHVRLHNGTSPAEQSRPRTLPHEPAGRPAVGAGDAGGGDRRRRD